MHILARQVRFSINPFLPEEIEGFNSYVSRPTGEGLSIFLELTVEVVGEIEPDTGFVVNVADIDENVRKFAVPVFSERIKQDFQQAKHIDFSAIVEILKTTWSCLVNKFGRATLNKLSLKLNPMRKVTIESKDLEMVYFSENFEFAATHKLWNEDFSEKQNLEVFGKCANPTGHGHNYILEVTVAMPKSKISFNTSNFQKIVDEELIRLVDHKNLNIDINYFNKINPTVENITVFAWDRLSGKFGQAVLHGVTVWETDKTYCSYYGPTDNK